MPPFRKLLGNPIEVYALTELGKLALREVDRRVGIREWISSQTQETGSWSPYVDLYEEDKSYIIRAELPDIKTSDIEITASENSITIKGERRAPEGVNQANIKISELYYGGFSRIITLPQPIQTDSIEADLTNGMLEIHMQKSNSEKPSIKVKVKSK